VPGVTNVQLKPRQIRKVAIIGGGLMGSGIATSLLISNISVVLKEVNPQFLQRGQKMIAGNFFKKLLIYFSKKYPFAYLFIYCFPCTIKT
jgi:NADPH-dependent 2,4-dienoyl-CoA reductase/sulfur reductase-like enzyme